MALLAGAALAAPPSNDGCENAVDLTPGEPTTVSSAEATDSGVTRCASTDDKDVWFYFRTNTTRNFDVSLCGSSFNTTLGVFEGCGGPMIACNDQGGACINPDSSELTEVLLTQNVDYFFRVAGVGSTTGSITVVITPSQLASPSNDECANAISLSEGVTATGNNFDATDSGAPRCEGSDHNDVWFHYQPAADQLATISLCDSDFDTTLSLFDACGGNEIACNDQNGTCPSNQSSLDCVPLTGGQDYYLRVAGYHGQEGNISILVDTAACVVPVNDDCANALPLTVGVPATGSTLAASVSAPAGCSVNDIYDVWYSYTPATDSLMDISLCGSSFDTTLNVYAGCAGLQIACNDDNPVCANYASRLDCIPMTGGTTYLIRVAGWEEARGNYVLDITQSDCTPPVNDSCANALPIVDGVAVVGSTAGASGEIVSTCGTDDYYDVWYAYTPPVNAVVDFATCGSAINTSLSVWDSCGGTELACNDDSSQCGPYATVEDLAVTGGATYLVRVAAAVRARGDFNLFILPVGAPYAAQLSPSVSSPTNADSAEFSVVFNEDVQDFNDAGDLVFSENGVTHTGVSISGGGSFYTVTVTGIAGDGTLSLAASTASDITSLTAAPLAYSVNSPALVIDNTAPMTTVFTEAPPIVNQPVYVTLNLSEESSNLETVDLVLLNADLLGHTYGVNSLRLELAPIDAGPFGFTLPAGAYTDLAGNPSTEITEYFWTYDNTEPVLSNVVISPSVASVDEEVTISFSFSEPLQVDPLVFVNGNEAARVAKADYVYSYIVQESDAAGPAEVVIGGVDVAGNLGVETFSAQLTIVPDDNLPLAAWPAVAALGAAGLLALRTRRR